MFRFYFYEKNSNKLTVSKNLVLVKDKCTIQDTFSLITNTLFLPCLMKKSIKSRTRVSTTELKEIVWTTRAF